MKLLRNTIISIYQQRRKLIVIGMVIVFTILLLIVANYSFVGRYNQYVFNDRENLAKQLKNTKPVGIVLGGGIKGGKPKPLLKDRLDTAARLLESGTVRKLIVSGDNRFVHYNEPQVMRNYLVREKGISPKKIQLDNAGRSTYETCERARKIFGLKKTVLISESTHLPRAIYLCRSFGIEAYGLKSDGESSAGLRIGQRWREVMARTKASINIYFIGERTVLGNKIKV